MANAAPQTCPFCSRRHPGVVCIEMQAEAIAIARRMPETRVLAMLTKRRLSTRAQLLAGTGMTRPDRKPVRRRGLVKLIG